MGEVFRAAEERAGFRQLTDAQLLPAFDEIGEETAKTALGAEEWESLSKSLAEARERQESLAQNPAEGDKPDA